MRSLQNQGIIGKGFKSPMPKHESLGLYLYCLCLNICANESKCRSHAFQRRTIFDILTFMLAFRRLLGYLTLYYFVKRQNSLFTSVRVPCWCHRYNIKYLSNKNLTSSTFISKHKIDKLCFYESSQGITSIYFCVKQRNKEQFRQNNYRQLLLSG